MKMRTRYGTILAAHFAEWYGEAVPKAIPAYHAKHHPSKSYCDFAAEFKAEHFDPAAWAELFKRAGAKYVVLTSKHHEGFALWPSAQSPYYNAGSPIRFTVTPRDCFGIAGRPLRQDCNTRG